MSERLTDAELDEAFEYARGSLRLTAALSELRERRAADLTAFQRIVLRTLRDDVVEDEHHDVNVVRILDRLIEGRP